MAMPNWISAMLSRVGPMTERAPALIAVGEHIAAELASGDSVVEKAVQVEEDVAAALPDIMAAIEPAAPAAV